MFNRNLSRDDINRGMIHWNVNYSQIQSLSSGVYIIKLHLETSSESKKIMFIK